MKRRPSLGRMSTGRARSVNALRTAHTVDQLMAAAVQLEDSEYLDAWPPGALK